MNHMGTISDIKAAADILLAANKVPEYEKLLHAMDRIGELQDKLEQKSAELRASRELLNTLQKELDAIRDDSILGSQLVRERDHLRHGEFHYCIRCWTQDRRLGPIVTVQGSKGNHPQCSRCKQDFAGY